MLVQYRNPMQYFASVRWLMCHRVVRKRDTVKEPGNNSEF